MQQRAQGYRIINDELYKASVTTPLLKCVASSEGKQQLKEIHESSCVSHNGPRALVGKAFRQGFYWPTGINDTTSLVQHCEGCQLSASHSNRLGAPTTLICPTWPLQRWVMDLVGPLPTPLGNLRYVVVAVEYFTKWIEAKPLATITSLTVKKFFWQQIIC